MQIEKSLCQTGGASASTSSVREQLIDSLKTSKEYRHSFVEEKIRTGFAAQIKAIREQREGGLTQKRFAEMLGKSQSWVARLEDPNAAPPTLSTMLQVAYAFDVDLEVRFAPFSELVDWVSGNPHWIPGLSSETLAVEDFEHDTGLVADAHKQTGGAEIALPGFWDAVRSKPLAQNHAGQVSSERGHRTGIESAIQASEAKQQLGQVYKITPNVVSIGRFGAQATQGDAAA
jgi:transcriptional regulator with XRE-family HTH domain